MTTTITFRNDFHNTECNARLPESGVLSVSQVKRIRRTLCGIETCCCGGNLSERGPQDVMDIQPNSDGTVEITLHNDQAWAEEMFQEIDATPEACFDFDMGEDGTRYYNITGMTMTINLGFWQQLTGEQRDRINKKFP